MLKRLLQIDLKNFQAHADTSIDVDSNVVVLSGETDNGKTSIVRALNWLITNRPTGDGFVSKWVKHRNKKDALVMNSDAVCSVTVKVLDDEDKVHTITRAKTATENYYEVDGTKLSAIGTDVPKEVRDLLCMHDENYQDQDEKYYLLTLTGSQVSSKLNELVHLDSIDVAYSLLKRKKLDEGSHRKEYEAQMYDHRVAVDSLKHIPTLVSRMDDLKELSEQLTACQDDIDDIISLLDDINSVERRLERLPDVVRLERKIQRVSGLMKDLDDLTDLSDDIVDDIVSLRRMKRRFEDLPEINEKDIECLSKLIDRFDRASVVTEDISNELYDAQKVIGSIRDVPTELFEKWQSLNTHYMNCLNELSPIEHELSDAQNLARELEMSKEQVSELEKELPEICPLCGQPMKEHVHA